MARIRFSFELRRGTEALDWEFGVAESQRNNRGVSGMHLKFFIEGEVVPVRYDSA